MELWARTLPLFLAAMVSPAMLAIAVVILTTPKGRSNLAWFTIGWTIGVVAFMVFVAFGGHAAAKSPIESWADVGFGVLMIVLGVITFARRNVPKKPKNTSSEGHKGGPIAYVGGGFLGVISDFSSLIPLAAAMKEVGTAQIPTIAKLPFAVVGYFFISLPILVPLVGAFAAPQSSQRMLDKLSAWLDKHGALLVMIVFLAIGVYLIVKGGRALGWL